MKNLIRGALLAAATLTLAAVPFAGASTPPGEAASHATAKPKACPKGKVAKIVKGKRVCALKPCPKGKARKKVVVKGVASWVCVSLTAGGGTKPAPTAANLAPKGYDGTLSINQVTTAPLGSRTDATTVTWKWVNKFPNLALGAYQLQSADLKIAVTGGYSGCTLSGGVSKTYTGGGVNGGGGAPPELGYTDYSKTGSDFTTYDRAKPVYWYLLFNDLLLEKTVTNACPNGTTTSAYGDVTILLGTSTPGLFPEQALNSATESTMAGTKTTTSSNAASGGNVTVVTTYTWSWTAIR